ncbi:putative bifunctional diguanylate cyclase/phosphodiesterase [Xanthobacter pseudotagetidis]|uniref:putative bifunctional diguanylate cyclase/phosphodiesterase n=1 Tax=Xanthobacter pseudotagetidis TaxID=3119911 RepID=UPI003727F4AC
MIYWVIVALWLAVLCAVARAAARGKSGVYGTTWLLLAVLAIDVVRNIAENFYFGLLWGSRYGVFPEAVETALARPELLILPKILNVLAAILVLVILLWRWLPLAATERSEALRTMSAQSAQIRREAEEQRLLFETSVDLILVIDRAGIVRRVSKSSAAILGYLPEEMVGREGSIFAVPEQRASLKAALSTLAAGQRAPEVVADMRHKDGHLLTLSFLGVWAPGLDSGLVIGRDITERMAAALRLDRLAYFDQLSGLPNRVSLLRDLSAALDGADASPLALAVFDLDGFKDINDFLGHSTGDRVIGEIGARLMRLASDGCRFYRSGGDEFFMLFKGGPSPDAGVAQAEEVVRILEERIEVDGYRLFVSVSCGLARAPDHGHRSEDLILNADLALNAAKAGGARKLGVFAPAIRTEARARQEIESELRRAVAQQEFELHFQPQIRLADDAIVGAEALLRWRHPERGLLAPAAFIDALSRSPAAAEAGQFVLTSACEAAAAWREKGLGALRIGVNLFPIQFHSRTLLDDVESALARSGLDARQLELEITENIALGHGDEVLDVLKALHKRGIGLAFDDFGTGYASLSYLLRYPLTRLKIDRSFVQKIADAAAPEHAAIVQSILVMAHNIGLEVVAEGVETERQMAFLRAHRCEEAQGYFFARPLPRADFDAFASARLARPTRGLG